MHSQTKVSSLLYLKYNRAAPHYCKKESKDLLKAFVTEQLVFLSIAEIVLRV